MKSLPTGADAPKTFDEVTQIFTDNLESDDIDFIRENGAGTGHFTIGMWMRNNWGLWSGGPLQDWFKARGLGHADDMTGCIFDWLDCHANETEFDLEASINHYKDFWKRQGIDPLTQEAIKNETLAT
jgi:hypothetical protein